MQTIFQKCHFEENGKLSKLFCLILWGLNFPVGPDTPQNKIMQSVRPLKTRSCGVSDPAELSLAGYQTPQNNVHFIADAYSARSDTSQNKVSRVLITRLTKSCWVSEPAEQSFVGYQTPGNKFKYEYFREFETELKNILGCDFGDYMGSICGKKQK